MASKPKQKCKYGATCYRKNRDHLDNFQHQKDSQSGDDEENGTTEEAVEEEEENNHQEDINDEDLWNQDPKNDERGARAGSGKW